MGSQAQPEKAAVCRGCGRPAGEGEATLLLFGEGIYHQGCAPRCGGCGRLLDPNQESSWKFETSVLWTGAGYTQSLAGSCCPSCLEQALRDTEPSALD